MKAIQHIRIAKIMSGKISNKLCNNSMINKIAYYIGSIAPDLNCIYPAHRINDTYERFQKKIKRVDKLSDGIIKSFTLGVITHYVCDYFCFAHNNNSIGVKHTKYERGLNKYFELHKRLFFNKDILVEWEEAKEIINQRFISNKDTLDINLHADIVIEQLKILNSNYCEKSNSTYNKMWTACVEQWQRDLEYCITVCENMLSIIIEPINCICFT